MLQLDVDLVAHVFSDGPREPHSWSGPADVALLHSHGDLDRLPESFVDEFALVPEDLVEVGERQISVDFFDFGFALRVRVAVGPHLVVVFGRFLQNVKVVVLDVPSAEFIRYFVVNYVFALRLQVENTDGSLFAEEVRFLVFWVEHLLDEGTEVLFAPRSRCFGRAHSFADDRFRQFGDFPLIFREAHAFISGQRRLFGATLRLLTPIERHSLLHAFESALLIGHGLIFHISVHFPLSW